MVSASPMATSIAPRPLIETLILPVPVFPISRAGTPSAFARASTAPTCSAVADTTTRDADSENNVDADTHAAGASAAGRSTVNPIAAGPERTLRKRHREAALRTVVSRSREPFARCEDQQLLQCSFCVQIHLGRHACDYALGRLQLVLAAPEFMPGLTEQNDRVAAALEAAAEHLARVLNEPHDTQHGRRIDRPAIGFVVEADIAAGNRDVERLARGGDPFDGFAELPHDFRPFWITEVQAVGRTDWRSPGARHVPRSFNHSKDGSSIRIEIAVAAVAIDRQGKRAIGALDANHSGSHA